MSARTAVEAALARIEALEGELGALLDVDEEGAFARADELDREAAAGLRGPLHGVPFLAKSNLCVRARPTSCASRVLEGYRPPFHATVVERLVAAGAIPLGSTNMDEFGFGSSGENSSFGATRNPWDLSRIPGGSSSGSAAAVAARLVPFALGSDTGGSIRQPAALCGITGFKPSYGRVSRFGLIAFASSLDTVGVLAPSAAEIERVLAVISGADPRDATCLELGPVEPEPPRTDLRGVRVGVPRECFADGLDARVRERVESALDELRRLGATLVPVELPHTQHALATYYVIASAEASSNLSRYDGVRYGAREAGDGTLQGMIAATRSHGFGAEALRRVLLGTHVLSAGHYDAWFLRAARARRLVRDDFLRVLGAVDVLATPTSPELAFRFGAKEDDALAMYLCDALTVPTSLAGLPAASVPCGLAEDDGVELPVGLQLIGAPLADARVLAIARTYQSVTRHHERVPPLAGGAR